MSVVTMRDYFLCMWWRVSYFGPFARICSSDPIDLSLGCFTRFHEGLFPRIFTDVERHFSVDCVPAELDIWKAVCPMYVCIHFSHLTPGMSLTRLCCLAFNDCNFDSMEISPFAIPPSGLLHLFRHGRCERLVQVVSTPRYVER